MANAHAHWRLPALVFVAINQLEHTRHVCHCKAHGQYVCAPQILLDVGGHNRVQHCVVRQAILIRLIGTQLGRRRPRNDALRDDWRKSIAVSTQAIDQGFKYVFEKGKATRHVAVQGTVANGHLTFVTGSEHHAAKFIRQGHQQHAANSGL